MSSVALQSEPQVVVVPADQLDVQAHAALHQEVFGHVLEENGIPLTRLGPEVFAWKLSPPRGLGRVAQVHQGGKLVATLSAYPLAIGGGRRGDRGWHICDAATADQARGQGLYNRLLKTFTETLPRDEWLFAFPNSLSRGAFERLGYSTRIKIPLWVRPTIGRPRIVDEIVQTTALGPEHDELARRLVDHSDLSTLRTAAYLRWRYLEHPYFDYQCFEYRSQGQVQGLLVLNRMEARGRVSLWVMELLGTSREVRHELAKAARAFGKEQGCDVVLSMSNVRFPGAVRLPPCFLPKEHVLVVRLADGDESWRDEDWEVQTGDWDTF